MNIVEVVDLEDGSTVAYIADDEGNLVGTNVYSHESRPRPVMGEIEPLTGLRRLWSWLTGEGS